MTDDKNPQADFEPASRTTPARRLELRSTGIDIVSFVPQLGHRRAVAGGCRGLETRISYHRPPPPELGTGNLELLANHYLLLCP